MSKESSQWTQKADCWSCIWTIHGPSRWSVTGDILQIRRVPIQLYWYYQMQRSMWMISKSSKATIYNCVFALHVNCQIMNYNHILYSVHGILNLWTMYNGKRIFFSGQTFTYGIWMIEWTIFKPYVTLVNNGSLKLGIKIPLNFFQPIKTMTNGLWWLFSSICVLIITFPFSQDLELQNEAGLKEHSNDLLMTSN